MKISIENLKLGEKDVYVVEEHHHVLLPWADFRIKSGKPFTTLTLDHHTDVMPANPECSFDLNTENVMRIVSMLRHDEHLDWAVKSGLIERGIIISQENFTVPASDKLIVICDERWPHTQEILDSSEKAREMASAVLESEFLRKQLLRAEIRDGETLVLDIDLDYFMNGKSLRPENIDIFMSLVRRSEFITISMERDWVNILRMKNENINAEIILYSLKEIIRNA